MIFFIDLDSFLNRRNDPCTPSYRRGHMTHIVIVRHSIVNILNLVRFDDLELACHI